MSRLFYAVNRETGERWQPPTSEQKFFSGTDIVHEYLMMYDTGTIAVVSEYSYGGEKISKPLCNKTWKVVFNESMQNKIDKSEES